MILSYDFPLSPAALLFVKILHFGEEYQSASLAAMSREVFCLILRSCQKQDFQLCVDLFIRPSAHFASRKFGAMSTGMVVSRSRPWRIAGRITEYRLSRALARA